MNTYLFKTNATMKEYNQKNYWVDYNLISDKYIEAKNIDEALKKYVDDVNDNSYYTVISKSALKNKKPIYRDKKNNTTIQVGYILTGAIYIDKGNYKDQTKQYIDLWIEIFTISRPKFELIVDRPKFKEEK